MSDPSWGKRSPECRDIVTKMLTMDPKKRISSKEALQHPWIQQKAGFVEEDIAIAAGALTNLKNFRVRTQYVTVLDVPKNGKRRRNIYCQPIEQQSGNRRDAQDVRGHGCEL